MLRKLDMRNRPPRRASRKGLSILEVLVSIGILVLGLLGVVVLIPIAAQKLRRGMALDDSTAVARAALADFEARGGTNMQRWLRYHPTLPPPNVPKSPMGTQMNTLWGVQQTNPVASSSFIHPSWSFCIDPLMYESVVVENGGTGRDNCFFPYQPYLPLPSVPAHLDLGSGITGPSFSINHGGCYGRMIRVTLNWNQIDWANRFPQTPVALTTGLAENVFRNADDLLLTSPGQEPQEGLMGLTALDNELPASQYDSSMQSWDLPSTTRIKRNANGNLSWFATLVPLQGNVSTGGARYYTLSVAVVEKRDLVIDQTRESSLESDDPNNTRFNLVESERVAGVNFIGGGQGGGEIQLVSRINDPSRQQQAIKNLSGIREGNWILISGPDPDPTSVVPAGSNIFLWYKIISIDPEPQVVSSPSGPQVVRNCTLRGPDWPAGVSYSNYPPEFLFDGEAIIVSNVINVFEKTVEIRGN